MLTRAVLDELEALRGQVAELRARNEALRVRVDGLEEALAPAFTLPPRQRQALTILRNRASWSDEMVASICGLTEADVAEVRRELEPA